MVEVERYLEGRLPEVLQFPAVSVHQGRGGDGREGRLHLVGKLLAHGESLAIELRGTLQGRIVSDVLSEEKPVS